MMKKFFKYGIFVPTLIALSVVGFVLFHYPSTATEKADCAVIFGAAVWREDIPSHALYDRIVGGIKLHQSGLVDCLILSGGDSKYGSHEVDVMKKLMGEVQIPMDDLELDYLGTNTGKTVGNLQPDRSYIFVSNDFHLARIRLFAWRFGHQNSQFHTAEYNYGRYLKEPYFFTREVLAIFWYFKWELLLFFAGLYFLKRKGLVILRKVWYFCREKIIKT